MGFDTLEKNMNSLVQNFKILILYTIIMISQSIRDKVKEDFRRDYIKGTSLEGNLRGIGYSTRGEKLVIELRYNKYAPKSVLSKLPKYYSHKTGTYPVNVVGIGRFTPR